MDNYEHLRRILDTHPSRAPESPVFDKILRMLFSQDDADIAVHMSFKPKKAGEIALAAGLSPEEAAKRLENMADRVIIFAREKDGEMLYSLLPTIPGIFEFPFMKGAATPELREIGRLWEEYHAGALGNAFAGNPTPGVRVFPLAESLKGNSKVLAHEEAKAIIVRGEYICLTNCACRESTGHCDAPRDVCLGFGTGGKFLVDRGYARQISREEALGVLDRAAAAGLVHVTDNHAGSPGIICNCCPCCCTILRGRTQLNHPHAVSPSSFAALVDEEKCTACGICADERCPVKAVTMEGDTALVKADACIGCGLCVTGCPTEAITMMPRAQAPVVPANVKEMALKIMQEKGILKEFLERGQK